ncbi:MAG: hypothetical protein ACRDX9_01870, partial [Acidimicrobiia bacterium]
MATGQILFPVSDEQGNESLGSCDLTVGEPGEITHGSQITTANTGWQGLGLTLGQLTPSGSITTSSNGQVIEGLDISGQVNINHDNVTVRGC